jgi:lipopolysaccharide/colanic/teichoic acid biosynthesis glycosyltransferase
MLEITGINSLTGNIVAVIIVFWTRLSIEPYPGIRRSYVILPSVFTGHGVIMLWLLLTRLPYDRLGLLLGFVLHVLWLYAVYIYGERETIRRIGVVPFGRVNPLFGVNGVEWKVLKRPRLVDAKACDAIVADFSANLPNEWEAFLADAALEGRLVYQHKQLAESLTGRVEIERLSENSFGSLLPARGYFYMKSVIDFICAIILLPIALPIMAVTAVAIVCDDGIPVVFRQKRVGHAGRSITVYKFRTMRAGRDSDDKRAGAMTREDDDRVTRVGRVLRKLRIDELPQMLNILKWEMSWIGPRPEAEVLSVWYTGELPFYRYRHVVKPGISGWAQVNQGHVAEVDQVHTKLQYDFYYIKYFSPWLDLLIVLRTIKTILTGWGAR